MRAPDGNREVRPSGDKVAYGSAKTMEDLGQDSGFHVGFIGHQIPGFFLSPHPDEGHVLPDGPALAVLDIGQQTAVAAQTSSLKVLLWDRRKLRQKPRTAGMICWRFMVDSFR